MYDGDRVGFDRATAIRGCSTGIYDITQHFNVATPEEMVRLTFVQDDDANARRPDVFALASGFIVLA